MQSAFPAPSCWVLADETRLGVQERRVLGFPARSPSPCGPLWSQCIPGFPLRLCLSWWPPPWVPDLVPPVSLCALSSQVLGSGHRFNHAGRACRRSSPADQLRVCSTFWNQLPCSSLWCSSVSQPQGPVHHHAGRRPLRFRAPRSCAWFAELCSVRRALTMGALP